MAAKRKTAAKSPGTRRKRRGVKIEAVALEAPELARVELAADASELAETVARDGGAVLAPYRDPLGGHTLLMVALPIDRDASDAHVRKLTRAMDKTKRFLDPIIIVRSGEQYYTPNGNHRLTAMKELGAKAIVGLLVPEYEVAYQILALNIEKAHNLRERALEVVRMYRDLLRTPRKAQLESAFDLEFEEPALVTLGFAYELRGRISGGAYHPALRKVDAFAN